MNLRAFAFVLALLSLAVWAAEKNSVPLQISGTGMRRVTGLLPNTCYRIQCKGMDGGAPTWFAIHYRAGTSTTLPDAGPHDSLIDFTQNHDSYPVCTGPDETVLSVREIAGGAVFCDLYAPTASIP